MLDDPHGEIDEVIRWFGSRGKLFNVHFRNIRGRRLDFMEAFPERATWTWRARCGCTRRSAMGTC